MKLIVLISFFGITFAAENKKRFTNSSNDGKTNPLLWMILNQISGLETKISKLQDKNEQVNKEISELKLKQKETDNNTERIKTINSKISEIRKFQNHKSSSGNDKAISKIKAEIKNLKIKHSNDGRRTKQILKLKGDVKDLRAKHVLDDKKEKQLQEVNKRLGVLQNKFGKLKQQGGNKNFWIGLNDLTREGWYTWISDYSAVTFTDWISGNPDNNGNEDCCEIRGSSWNDIYCSNSNSFICEKNAD